MRNDRRRARAAGIVFAYSNWDAVLVLVTLVQLVAILWAAANFDRLGAAAITVYALVQIVLATTQYDVITHNFIHTRFFRSRTLNRVYALVCSAIGMSLVTEQTLEHLHHHKHVNDPRDRATGETKDPSSTFRFGKDGGHEAMWRYALLSPLRHAFESPDYSGRRARIRRQIRIEAIVTVAFWIAIGLTDWRFLLLSFFIVYAAQALNAAQNYLEHYGAVPEDRMADSVSCYGRLYNLLWFNNGYHQEHHFRPGVHWTKLKQLRRDMLPEDRRRVVGGAHFLHLPTAVGATEMIENRSTRSRASSSRD